MASLDNSMNRSLDHLKDTSIFVTGHTGFKGSWLALWLSILGAKVHGFSLPSENPSLFSGANVTSVMDTHTLGDIRNLDLLTTSLRDAQPRLVFHLAAQALVRPSYTDPVSTWNSNLLGTVHLLEAVRHCSSVKAVVLITTDKCYENHEWEWGYRENDRLGGHDPYSASKAACELAISSYRQSFLQNLGVLVASVRAGNVIGGGDYGKERLIPDVVRAVNAGIPLEVRHPEATRPWQHVLCALHGYLLLANGLLAGRKELAQAFNFGPAQEDNRTVRDILHVLQKHWPALKIQHVSTKNPVHEANFLYLDASRAKRLLNWHPAWKLDKALGQTVSWYRETAAHPEKIMTLCRKDIEEYMSAVS